MWCEHGHNGLYVVGGPLAIQRAIPVTDKDEHRIVGMHIDTAIGHLIFVNARLVLRSPKGAGSSMLKGMSKRQDVDLFLKHVTQLDIGLNVWPFK